MRSQFTSHLLNPPNPHRLDYSYQYPLRKTAHRLYQKTAIMNPEPFDIVELLVSLPEDNLLVGTQGAIVEQYSDNDFEVEFSNEAGETLALCTLPQQKFIVVWKSATQQ